MTRGREELSLVYDPREEDSGLFLTCPREEESGLFLTCPREEESHVIQAWNGPEDPGMTRNRHFCSERHLRPESPLRHFCSLLLVLGPLSDGT